MRRVGFILLAGSLVAGCAASAGPFPGRNGAASYRHPVTGDVQHCVNSNDGAGLQMGVLAQIGAGNAYADCKSQLERMGYQRERLGS